MNNVLLTDRVFLSLSVPLQPEQERELEESLLLDGCREPIITWNGVIIDGHKRYHFCSAEGIEYSTEEMDFLSTEEAISWVCRKHIPKYGKKSVPYRYLVGRFYKAQKEIYREIRKQPESMRRIQLNPEWDRVSYYIAEELNLHHATIESHGAYAAAMEQIADKAWNLFEAILSETITASKNNILEYAGMDIKQLDELCRDRWNMSHDERSAIRIRTRRKRREPAEPIKEIPLSVGIKEMPTYDPDMEVNGLSLTIPTWIIAINRAKKKTEQATENGKAQLARSLIRLRDEIDELLEDIGHG